VTGESLGIGFNDKFFSDAVKAVGSETTNLFFNGPDGHMLIRPNENPYSFLCLVAPLELSA
jgi:DNA polymerase III sliding clamp (beta) subunit (PCNA family)